MRTKTRPRQRGRCLCKEGRFWRHSERDWKRLKEADREMRDAVRR